MDPDLTVATQRDQNDDFPVAEKHLTRHQAYQLVSLAGNVAVTQLSTNRITACTCDCRRASSGDDDVHGSRGFKHLVERTGRILQIAVGLIPIPHGSNC